MLLYVTAAAEDRPFAAKHWKTLANLCYRISSDGHLLRNDAPKNGLMVLSDAGEPSFENPRTLIKEILQEMRYGAFSGVAADFEERPCDSSAAFLRLLGEQLRYIGKRFFLPEEYAGCCQSASVLLCTAMSGGNYERRLRRAAQRVGTRRLSLDLQWLRMDFPLPCPDGEGEYLTAEELRKLKANCSPVTFYSKELAAEYFTYSRGEEHHFVLYDTPDTLTRKLCIAAKLGCGAVFLMASEAGDELETLISRFRKEKLI